MSGSGRSRAGPARPRLDPPAGEAAAMVSVRGPRRRWVHHAPPGAVGIGELVRALADAVQPATGLVHQPPDPCELPAAFQPYSFPNAARQQRCCHRRCCGRLFGRERASRVPFARLQFWGRDVLFVALLSGLMLPIQIAAIPEFIEVKYLGLLNSQLSLIFPALIQVFGIFLLREHFKTIPDELEEAARLEGAGELRILRLVVVPLSWPAIYATAIITAQYIWNDFFWPNLYITSASRMVAPLGLVTLQNAYQSGPVGAIFAGLSILVIPVAVFFVFVQRQLMEGLGFAGISR